jgi:hypothetical protein
MPLSSSTMSIGAVKSQLDSIQEKRSTDTGSPILNTPDAVYRKGGKSK